MTDPADPLAHLYAEGLEPDRDVVASSAMEHLAHLYGDFADDDEELELEPVEVSVDGLNAELDPEAEEELSDHDLEELVLLVRLRLDEERGLPDDEAAELGLGDLVDDGSGELELVLNDVGRAVLGRLVDERFPGLRS